MTGEISDRLAKLESDVHRLKAKVFPQDVVRAIKLAVNKELQSETQKITDQVAEINALDIPAREKQKRIAELEGISRKKMEKLADELNEKYRRNPPV